MDDSKDSGWFSKFLSTATEGYKAYTGGEQAKADKKLANAINNRVDANAQSSLFSTRNIIAAVVGVVLVIVLVMFTRK